MSKYPKARLEPAWAARRLKGKRITKPLRFTLPTELADRLEAMSKAERDAWAVECLKK